MITQTLPSHTQQYHWVTHPPKFLVKATDQIQLPRAGEASGGTTRDRKFTHIITAESTLEDSLQVTWRILPTKASFVEIQAGFPSAPSAVPLVESAMVASLLSSARRAAVTW